MSTAQITEAIKDSRYMTDVLCDLYEDNNIDYITFLNHTALKVRFLRKNLNSKKISFVDKMDIADVLKRHSAIVNGNNINHIRMAQQG